MSYDETDAESIEQYARLLIGKTFLDVLNEAQILPKERLEYKKKYSNVKHKGSLGNLLERVYFGYEENSDTRADFHEAGVELKVSPYEVTKKNQCRVGERLVLGMIKNTEPIKADLYQSNLWAKIQKILLIYYLRDKKLQRKLDYSIDYVSMFTPSEVDLEIIQEDYKKIVSKIKSGKAHELSESDTIYLAACTKGATADGSFAPQYYNANIPAKRRAFSFKVSYMNVVLKNIISETDKEKAEVIIKDKKQLKKQSFEDVVLSKIAAYYGKSDEQLCKIFNYKSNKNKAQWANLSWRMLGIKSNKATEFVKANIIVKTIKVEENGKIKEHISSPAFKFKDLIEEEWEDSKVYNYFEQTKFLFIIFEKKNNQYILSHAKFWNMPSADLEGDVKLCWEQTVKKIKTGITFEISSKKIKNDLPSSKDNKVAHVRPHAIKRAYRLKGGIEVGNIERDANELPDGQWMTHQSFWLNSSYIAEQLL